MTSLSVSAVQDAVNSLYKAMVSRDRTELSRWTAEELIYGHSTARTETKQQFMDGVLNAKQGFSEITFSDQRVTLIDNVALVYQVTKRTRTDGRSGSMNDFSVWMLRNGQWKLVGRQSVKA